MQYKKFIYTGLAALAIAGAGFGLNYTDEIRDSFRPIVERVEERFDPFTEFPAKGVATKDMPIRIDDDENSEIIGQLYKGDIVDVVEYRSLGGWKKWYGIESNGQSGYVLTKDYDHLAVFSVDPKYDPQAAMLTNVDYSNGIEFIFDLLEVSEEEGGHAIRVLGKIGDESTADYLINLYHTEGYGHYYLIVETVGDLGQAKHIMPFLSEAYYQFGSGVSEVMLASGKDEEDRKVISPFFIDIAENRSVDCYERRLAVDSVGELAERADPLAVDYIMHTEGDKCTSSWMMSLKKHLPECLKDPQACGLQ